MKVSKGIALLLAVVMLSAIALTSCMKVTIKQVENDPAGKNAEALGNTLSGFGESFAPISEPIDSLKNNGVVEIGWKNDEIGIDLSGVISYAKDDKSVCGDLSAKFGDSAATMKVIGSRDALAVSSPELFSGTYGVDLTTLVDDIKNSELFEGADRNEIADAAKALLEARDKLLDGDYGKLKEKWSALKSDLFKRINEAPHTIEKREISTVGRKALAITTTFELDEEALGDIIDIIIDGGDELVDEIRDILDEVILDDTDVDLDDIDFEGIEDVLEDLKEELDDEDADATVVVSLDPKTAELLKIEFKLTADDGKLEGEFDFGRRVEDFEKMTGFIKITSDDEDFKTEDDIEFTFTRRDDLITFIEELEIKYTQKVEGGYSGIAEYEVSYNSNDENTVKFTFDHDKTEKTYELSLSGKTDYSEETVINGETDTDSDTFEWGIALSGAFEYDKTGLTIGFDTLKVSDDDDTHTVFKDLGLTLKFRSGGTIESMPEYKNFVKLDRDGVTALGKEIEKNASGYADDLEALGEAIEDYFDLDDVVEDTVDYFDDMIP